jgi:hypothetical protein
MIELLGENVKRLAAHHDINFSVALAALASPVPDALGVIRMAI